MILEMANGARPELMQGGRRRRKGKNQIGLTGRTISSLKVFLERQPNGTIQTSAGHSDQAKQGEAERDRADAVQADPQG